MRARDLKWVARLTCGHDVYGDGPVPNGVWCPTHHDIYDLVDFISNEPEPDPDGRAY